MPKLRHLSARSRRDPSGTERLRIEFERKLIALFESFAERIKKAIPQSFKTLGAGEDASSFDDETLALIDSYILKEGETIVADYSKRFYISGKKKANALLKTVGIRASLGITPEDYEAIKLIAERDFTALKGVTDEMAKAMASTLTDGLLKGYGAEELQRAIRDEIDDIGIARARTIARTESMYAFNTASEAQYEAFGIRKVRWLMSVNHEDINCVCEDYDGNIFDIESAPDIPAHPNCACILLPEA